ncbi:MAG: hypothetical protein AAFN79_17800 [Pseudomonadota bacterium]
MNEGRLQSVLSGIGAARRRWRLPLLLATAGLVLAGCVYSAMALDLALGDLAPAPLLALALLLVPVSLGYAALNMKLTAVAVGAAIPLAKCLRIACFAQLAEVAPAPGGAIVRGAALIERGVAPSRAAAIVTANAILWIACAVFAAGLTARGAPPWAVMGALGLGAAGMAVSTLWIARIGSIRIASLSVVLRVVGLPVAALRMIIAFAAISVPIPAAEGFVFAFASIAGSAASIAPAGLGVSEGLAALLATMTAAAPAAAFLAVALNRIVGLIVAALASAVYALIPPGEARDG